MNDREMLELAAKSAGLQVDKRYTYHEGLMVVSDVGIRLWNPLTDDGDALRLAVKLQLQITPGTYNKDEFSAYSAGQCESREYYSYQHGEYAATRRAIVRAAAEVGKTM